MTIDLNKLNLNTRSSDSTSQKRTPVPLTNEDISRPSLGTKSSKSKLADEHPLPCLQCEEKLIVAKAAYSTVCPHCHAHLYFKNFTLSPTARRTHINTYGDIRILRGADLKNLSLRCRNLTLEGTASGDLSCTGTLTFEYSGIINAHIRAGHLQVPRRLSVTLRYPTRIHSAVIYGELIGNLNASGTVILKPGAVVMGDITAKHLSIPHGATHHGSYKPTFPFDNEILS